ncbi:hypothetical protein BDY24DRAFT_379949, partial [Mrakia frigida]|uniref:uncharacterized protein n=1 Tax=Mrakia frigida TaxID=29902 RepID=UPI003FCBFAC7
MASSFLNPWASEFRQELILNDSGSIDSLQDTVQRVGLDFIQAYMDQIFNSHEDHRPVIGDLIKTPSRKKGTTTSKRTRANAQADKDKLDKIKSANIKKDSSTDKENAASPAAASARVVKITSSQPFQAAAASSSSNNNNNKSPPLSPLRIGSSRTNNNTLLQQLQQVQPDSPQKKDALVKPVKEKGKKKKVKAVVEEGDGDDNEVAAVVAEQSAPVVVKKTKGGKVAKSGTVAAGGKKKKGTKKEKVVEPEPEPEVVEDEEEILLVVEEEEAVEVPSVEEVEMQEQEEEEEKVQAAAVVVRSRPATPPLVVAAAKPIPAVVEVDFAPQSAPAESQQAEDPVVVTAQDEEEEEEEIVPAVVAVAPEDIAIPSSELSPVEEEAPSLVVEDKAISLEATFVKPVATPSAVVPSRTPPTTAVAVSAPVAPAKEDSIDSSSPPPVSTKSSKVPTPVAALQQPAAVNSGSKTPYLPSSANASTWSARGGGSTSIVGLRSSWLSKALGGASDAPEGLRKSQGAALVAASREREKEREEAAIVARASAAASASAGPSSTHKRKSGDLAADASSTSFDQNQSQNSQYDDLNRRATKLPRVDDHATSSHPLSTLPSASTIPGRLPIMFSPPGAASTAADNHSGISRLKKEIEDLAAKTARSRALSSIGGPTTTAPIPSLRMSLAQRPA